MKRRVALAAMALTAIAALAVSGSAASAEPEKHAERSGVDRVAVRFWAAETGGPERPRFLTERVLAFEARLEALGDGTRVDEGTAGAPVYQDRYVRAAAERHVAEEILAALTIQRRADPPDLPKRAENARLALADRVGGSARLDAAMRAEGLDPSELAQLMRRQVRAALYVDAAIQPILQPTEEEVREVFRTDAHPFKGAKLDDVRDRFVGWLVLERLRQAESTFLQSARPRVKIVNVPSPAS